MQSCWAIGYGAAAIVTAIVLPRFGWRAVFFVGVLPALFTLWIRRSVQEPEIWRTARRAAAQGESTGQRRPFPIGLTVALTLMNAAAFLIAAAFWIFIPETKGRQLA